MSMSDKELEIEALGALFNQDEYTVQNDTVSIKISMCNVSLIVSFELPSNYPQSQPIISFDLEIDSQNLNNSFKDKLINNLTEIAQNSIDANSGYPCIYYTIEDIKAYLTTQTLETDNADTNKVEDQIDPIYENESITDHRISSQKLITYEEFKDWTDKFIKVLIERGDLPSDKVCDKLTGRQIFEQLSTEQLAAGSYSEHLYAESPEISDYEETPTFD